MEKGKGKKQSLVFEIISVAMSVLLIPACLISYASWLQVVVCIAVAGLDALFIYLSYISAKKYQRYLEAELNKAEEKKKKNSLIEIYGVLGISPQYKSDGTLKDVFELLKIKPEYDQNGNRIPTIYERLGINPLFTPNGTEIPFVFRIKNRINALVKAKEGTIPLFYVPRRHHLRGVEPLPILPVPGLPGEEPHKKPPIAIIPGSKKPAPPKKSGGGPKPKYAAPDKSKRSPGKGPDSVKFKLTSEQKFKYKGDGSKGPDIWGAESPRSTASISSNGIEGLDTSVGSTIIKKETKTPKVEKVVENKKPVNVSMSIESLLGGDRDKEIEDNVNFDINEINEVSHVAVEDIFGSKKGEGNTETNENSIAETVKPKSENEREMGSSSTESPTIEDYNMFKE